METAIVVALITTAGAVLVAAISSYATRKTQKAVKAIEGTPLPAGISELAVKILKELVGTLSEENQTLRKRLDECDCE